MTKKLICIIICIVILRVYIPLFISGMQVIIIPTTVPSISFKRLNREEVKHKDQRPLPSAIQIKLSHTALKHSLVQ